MSTASSDDDGAPVVGRRRHHGRVVIVDDSSDDDSFRSGRLDDSMPPADTASSKQQRRRFGDDDDLLNSSDDSFTDALKALQITQTLTDDEKDDPRDEAEGSGSDPDSSSSSRETSESLGSDDDDDKEPEVPTDFPRTLDRSSNGYLGSDDDDDDKKPSYRSEEPEVPTNFPWTLDRSSNEYYLAKDGDDDVEWPDLRIPAKLFKKLYDYQRTGVQFLASLHCQGIGGILGDDMGMGKTYMTLSYLGGLMRSQTIRNALVVAPVSVLRSWEKEAANVLACCVPRVRIIIVSSDLPPVTRVHLLRQALHCRPTEPHLIISTYGMVRESPSAFTDRNKSHWDYVVCDEGHTLKNPSTAISKCCREICGNPQTRRFMLSGTPIMNNLKELWALFDWATSGQVLGSLKDFNSKFAKPIEAARQKYAVDSIIRNGERANKELQASLQPHFLQRLKGDYLKDKLPPKTELVVWTQLSSQQRVMYTEFVNEGGVVGQILAGEKTSPLEAITWLKKLCGHPLLIEQPGEKLSDALQKQKARSITEQSPKMQILMAFLHKFRSEGHRTLVFSQSTRMLDIIEKAAKEFAVARIDGSTKERDRQRLVDIFNSDQCAFHVMLLSTKAAGLGLTLTGSCRVIVYDPSWNPAEDAQAVDRSYRIGQKNPVLVYRLIAAGTVEEKMYEKQVYKDGIRRTVFTEGSSVVERYFDHNELRALFKLGDPGVCKVMEKISQTAQHLEIEWSRHGFILEHEGTVGISRHDGFYHESASGEAKLFDGRTPAKKKTVGRSQRVLQGELDNSAKPLGRKASLVDRSKNKSDRDKENHCPGPTDRFGTANKILKERKVPPQSAALFMARARSLNSKGNPKRSLKLLLDVLDTRKDELDPDERVELHKQISSVAGGLGLLKSNEI